MRPHLNLEKAKQVHGLHEKKCLIFEKDFYIIFFLKVGS